MTENRIFQILLKNHNKNVNSTSSDFPKLQAEAVAVVAEKFTDILYDTNQSSTNQSLKRKVLQYLHTTCKVRQCHVAEGSYESFLKVLKETLQCDVSEDISNLKSEVECELAKDVPITLSDKMIDFYKRKNSKHKEILRKLEFIGEKNQKDLNLKFGMQARRNFSYYEVNENTIKDLIGFPAQIAENKSVTSNINTIEYREKQIKFCYALLNLKSNFHFFDIILHRLGNYKKLEPFEVNFLLALWNFEDESSDFSVVVSEKFPLVLERMILKNCTEILYLKEDVEVNQYFSSLDKDKQFIKLRKLCLDNDLLKKKAKSLLYELYCYSFCNRNILKLMDFIR